MNPYHHKSGSCKRKEKAARKADAERGHSSIPKFTVPTTTNQDLVSPGPSHSGESGGSGLPVGGGDGLSAGAGD